MITFKQFLLELKLSRLVGALSKGQPVGTISPERLGMNSDQKQQAHVAMRAALSRERDKGMISFSGAHAGRYKYAETEAPAKEGSYVLRPGNHSKAKENFHRILTHLGRRFGQESVMKVKKLGKGAPHGAFHYTDGTKKVEPKGTIHYNAPLEKGSGDTKLKGSQQSFTVKK